MSRPKLFRIIDKAVYDYKLIENGDRIAIGASGGKDSTALLEYFADRKRQGRKAVSALRFPANYHSCLPIGA